MSHMNILGQPEFVDSYTWALQIFLLCLCFIMEGVFKTFLNHAIGNMCALKVLYNKIYNKPYINHPRHGTLYSN